MFRKGFARPFLSGPLFPGSPVLESHSETHPETLFWYPILKQHPGTHPETPFSNSPLPCYPVSWYPSNYQSLIFTLIFHIWFPPLFPTSSTINFLHQFPSLIFTFQFQPINLYLSVRSSGSVPATSPPASHTTNLEVPFPVHTSLFEAPNWTFASEGNLAEIRRLGLLIWMDGSSYLSIEDPDSTSLFSQSNINLSSSGAL